eukprot:scaffold470_cov257-Pinguiococcus_pyrenoidosus.AAC.13
MPEEWQDLPAMSHPVGRGLLGLQQCQSQDIVAALHLLHDVIGVLRANVHVRGHHSHLEGVESLREALRGGGNPKKIKRIRQRFSKNAPHCDISARPVSAEARRIDAPPSGSRGSLLRAERPGGHPRSHPVA